MITRAELLKRIKALEPKPVSRLMRCIILTSHTHSNLPIYSYSYHEHTVYVADYASDNEALETILKLAEPHKCPIIAASVHPDTPEWEFTAPQRLD